MSLRTAFSLVVPIACTTCLAVGYIMIGQWSGFMLALLALLAWLVARHKPETMPPSFALVFSTGIAAGGVLAGAAPLTMILGTVLALASWDLVLLYHSLSGSSSSSAGTLTLFEKAHLRYLALALGSSLLVVVTGRLLHFQIPFAVMVLLAIIAVFSLDRILRMFTGAG